MEIFSRVMLVGCGGFLGANARYWLGGVIQDKTGSSFPWNTLVVNVTGSFLIGVIFSMILGMGLVKSEQLPWQLFIVTGVLGGYTTFSTFSYESIHLILGRSYLYALYYIVGSLALSLVGTVLGIIVARLLGAREL